MGMSASQARMLSLTARMSDLELQAQSISNSKIRLADQAEGASREYCDALDKQKLTVFSGVDQNGNSTYLDATANNLTSYNAAVLDHQRFIKDSAGRVLVSSAIGTAYDGANGSLATFLTNCEVITDPNAPNYDAAKVTHYTNIFNEIGESGGYNAPGDNNMNSSEWLQAQVSAGNVFLAKWDDVGGTEGTGDFVDVSWTSGDSSIQEKDDKTGIARAEAGYETTMASIESKDKRFDLQLKGIDTEHNAIQTEIESVKKVIDKNIERSFKTFNG
jgi:hypothetical protein